MRQLLVSKFGGSSLADVEQFRKVREIVESNPNRRYIVPSAPGKRNRTDVKVTDLLYQAARYHADAERFDAVFEQIAQRYREIARALSIHSPLEQELEAVREALKAGSTKDYAASRGEYLNGVLLAGFLGIPMVDPAELIVFSENGRCNLERTQEKAASRLKGIERAVIPGYYGATEQGEIVTFSRGGSDVTGAIIANAVEATLYENWTDVSGFLMADPRIVKDAKTIRMVTYKELRELAYMGAPVLHEEVIFPLRRRSIPIHLCNTNRPQDGGTMVVDETTNPPITNVISGISGKKGFTVIMVNKLFMNTELGFLSRLCGIFDRHQVHVEHLPSSIDSISAITSDQIDECTLASLIADVKIECEAEDIVVHRNMSLVTVVGRGLAQTKGCSGRIFTALAENGVNIRMISQDSRELNIIIAVEDRDYEAAIAAIYHCIDELERAVGYQK